MKRPVRDRLRVVTAALLVMTCPGYAIDSASIASSALSEDCIDYQVVGICYWLLCTYFSCDVETSVRVRHYVPDAVVSSYSVTGENPWTDVASMSPATSVAQNGGDGTTNERHENNIANYKDADVIGHPGITLYNEFASSYGYACPGTATSFRPYLLSTFDTLAWRYTVPEMVYPESLIPGRREVGSVLSGNVWGNVYPRGGFLHQSDDYKAAAVVAQRAGDVVTRRDQPHVYQPMLPEEWVENDPQDGYWPAGALVETDETTGKWQELVPTLSSSCAVFPNDDQHTQATDGAYAWALWRPYSCCEREGQIFLGSFDYTEGGAQ
jgi:integrating conjugative element protein (TIGR03756 family)